MKKYINNVAVICLGLVLVGCTQSSAQVMTTTCTAMQPSFVETVTILAKSDDVQSETIHLQGSLQRVQVTYSGISDYEYSKGISVNMTQNGADALLSVGVDYSQVDTQDLKKASLFTGAHIANSNGEVSLAEYTAALEQKGYVCNLPK